MRNILKQLTLIFFCIITFIFNAQNGILKISGIKAQIGYNSYNYLGLGFNPSNPSTSQSQWGIEHWDGGLNFFKPFPSYNQPGTDPNFKFFIHDMGFIGINGKPNPGRVRSCGFLGLSTCNNFRLQIFGNAIANDWYTFSDSAIKENVINIQTVLPNLLKMKPIEYNYKPVKLSDKTSSEVTLKEELDSTDKPTTDPKRRYGFTAQEVSRIFPNLAEEFNDSIGVVNYMGFIPLLVRGLQEQQVIIEQLKQEVQELKGKTVYTDVDKTKLFQNNPNPFRGTTTFTYYIDESTNVSGAVIEIRNIMGTLQNSITLGDKSGLGKIEFNAENLAEGYYVYALKVNGNLKDSKMLLIGE